MVNFEDIEFFSNIYANMDFLLVPIYILAHTYFLFGLYWSVFFTAIFFIGLQYFELSFMTILFFSYFISNLFIDQRILRSSSQNIKNYAETGLTVIISIFLIMLKTGDIEPYQGAIIFLIFYVIQARYRTSTLTFAKLSDIDKKREINQY
jgi:hypothetical protein